MNNLELLNKLAELGVTFCLAVPNQWGHETHISDPSELLEFIDDPVSLYARYHGVTKQQYLAWANDEFSVVCSATTSKGKPCKKIVKGGSNVSPRQWVAMQGEYCSLHSDGN